MFLTFLRLIIRAKCLLEKGTRWTFISIRWSGLKTKTKKLKSFEALKKKKKKAFRQLEGLIRLLGIKVFWLIGRVEFMLIMKKNTNSLSSFRIPLKSTHFLKLCCLFGMKKLRIGWWGLMLKNRKNLKKWEKGLRLMKCLLFIRILTTLTKKGLMMLLFICIRKDCLW